MKSKIDVNFERRFFKKLYFFETKTTFFEILQVQVGSKDGPNIDQKHNAKYNASKHRFLSNFDGFWEPSWGQVGGKLALNLDCKSIQRRLGRLHIALGTYQVAPERESLIF